MNNVETFCHAARILDRGAKWFFDMGTEGSHGTKLFSVSGDCRNPGVYELPYGHSLAGTALRWPAAKRRRRCWSAARAGR